MFFLEKEVIKGIYLAVTRLSGPVVAQALFRFMSPVFVFLCALSMYFFVHGEDPERYFPAATVCFSSPSS